MAIGAAADESVAAGIERKIGAGAVARENRQISVKTAAGDRHSIAWQNRRNCPKLHGTPGAGTWNWSHGGKVLEWYVTTMSTIVRYPHIVKEPGLRQVGKPSAHACGDDRDGLSGPRTWAGRHRCHYPYLTLAEVHSAMTYYHDHQQEIDAEIQAELNQLKDTADANLRSAVWQKLKAKGVI